MTGESEVAVSVCLCTYHRQAALTACLRSLLNQACNFAFEVIVTDNDCNCSAKTVVDSLRHDFITAEIPLTYLVEPIQNIALARNRGVCSARGKYVAFLDDDECAATYWLKELHALVVELG